MGSRIDTDVYINGHLSVDSMDLPANAVVDTSVSATAAIARSKLASETKSFPVAFEILRIHDAMQTALPGTSVADDLGLYGGTFGTSAPLVRTYDAKNAGAVTLYARCLIPLPAEYDGGGTVTLRANGGMVTTVASTTATVDFEAYKLNKAGSIGSDLCATAAQSINSLTFAAKDFTVTPTGLNPGDILDVRVALAVNDTATGTAVIAALGSLELLCAVRG